MKYRDDREAMRHRADSLEAQLEQANEQLGQARTRLAQQQQKDEQEERRIAALESEVAHLRGRLGMPTHQQHRRPSRTRLVALAGLGFVLAGAVVGFTMVRSAAPPPKTSDAKPRPAIEVPAAASAKPVSGPPLAPNEVAFFGAEVIAESGGKASVGDGCIVRAQLRRGLQIGDVDVRCGNAVLYRSTDPRGSGTNWTNRGLSELSAADKDSWRYMMNYVDRGQHSGSRAEIDLDTPSFRGRVYREGAEAWSVSLHIRDVSFPRWGEALDAKSTISTPPKPLHMIAELSQKSGPAPGALGNEPCELRVRHNTGKANCRLMLRCGNRIVYGAGTGGFATCTTDESFVTAVDGSRSADDKDPAMTFDARKRTITIEDDAAGESWSLSYALEEQCSFAGRWMGDGIDASGTAWSFGWDVSGKDVSMKWKSAGGSGGEQAVIEGTCAHDQLQLQGQSVDSSALAVARYRIELGPGWKSLGGRWFTGTPGALAGVRTP